MLVTSEKGVVLILPFLFYVNMILCGTTDAIRPSYAVRGTPSCDKIVEIENSGLLHYLGNITFTSPTNFKGTWKLEMTTDKPFNFLGGWGVIVKVDAPNRRAEFYSKKIVELRTGDRISFRFRISYGEENIIPYVKLLKWQGVQICAPKATSVHNNSQTITRMRRFRFTYLNDTQNQSNHISKDGLRQQGR